MPPLHLRGLMGPAVLITVGVLFLLDQMRGGYFSFSNTWPVILLVIGAVNLSAALSSTEGHVSGSAPPPLRARRAPCPPDPRGTFPVRDKGSKISWPILDRRSSSLFAGLVLLFVGVLLLLHNYHGLTSHVIGRWWPLILIIWGATQTL